MNVNIVGKALGAFAAAFIIVCGLLYFLAHRFSLPGRAFTALLERMPATLELVIASVIIALVLAGACTLLSKGRTAPLGTVVSTALSFSVCIPLFWLTLIAQMVLAGRGVDVFPRLVLPATLLALVQAGAYADCMRGGNATRRLVATFALLLPMTFSADVLVETSFAWRGIGSLFYEGLGGNQAPQMAAYCLFIAAVVVVVRTVAGAASKSEDTDPVEVFQPL